MSRKYCGLHILLEPFPVNDEQFLGDESVHISEIRTLMPERLMELGFAFALPQEVTESLVKGGFLNYFCQNLAENAVIFAKQKMN